MAPCSLTVAFQPFTQVVRARSPRYFAVAVASSALAWQLSVETLSGIVLSSSREHLAWAVSAICSTWCGSCFSCTCLWVLPYPGPGLATGFTKAGSTVWLESGRPVGSPLNLHTVMGTSIPMARLASQLFSQQVLVAVVSSLQFGAVSLHVGICSDLEWLALWLQVGPCSGPHLHFH